MPGQSPILPIRFDNQVVLITGGGRGLGAAYAKLIAARGGTVVVHDAGVTQEGDGFDADVANAVVADIRAAGGVAAACHENLNSAEACHQTVRFALARFGRLDALVHSAGLLAFAPAEEMDPSVWDRILSVGVDAAFHLARAAIPHMRNAGYGRIVLTTSGRALRVQDSAPGLAAYCAAKMGQAGLMVALAAELRDSDILVNAISPVAATRMLQRDAPEMKPELVAPAVAFLASSACSQTGLIVSAAGGRFSQVRIGYGPVIDFGGGEPASLERMQQRWSELTAAPAR